MWPLFGKSNCPINAEMQEWVDGRFRWLQDQFGIDAPYKARVILPTAEFFPDIYEGRLEDVRAMLARICGYMNVDPARFELYLFNESGPMPIWGSAHLQFSGAAGLYHMAKSTDKSQTDARSTIGIDASRLRDPMSLVATLAHEVGHEILLGQRRISRDEPDHEPLTDLLTVFLGLGVFTANSTIRDKAWHSGGWSGWQTSRLGYLNQRTFGYALAQFARVRGESKPPWLKHLRPDVRTPLLQSLRFLASEI